MFSITPSISSLIVSIASRYSSSLKRGASAARPAALVGTSLPGCGRSTISISSLIVSIILNNSNRTPAILASVTANKFVISGSYLFSKPIRFIVFETFWETASD